MLLIVFWRISYAERRERQGSSPFLSKALPVCQGRPSGGPWPLPSPGLQHQDSWPPSQVPATQHAVPICVTLRRVRLCGPTSEPEGISVCPRRRGSVVAHLSQEHLYGRMAPELICPTRPHTRVNHFCDALKSRKPRRRGQKCTLSHPRCRSCLGLDQ